MILTRRRLLVLLALSSLGNKVGSGWENPGPAKQVIIAGTSGELLVYEGTPAARNLILAISGVAGSDAFGNEWGVGLTLASNVVGGLAAFLNFINEYHTTDPANIDPPGIYTQLDGAGLFQQLFLQGPHGNAQASAMIQLLAPPPASTTGTMLLAGGNAGITMDDFGLALEVLAGTGMRWGNTAPRGRYYYEEVSLSAQSIPTGVSTVFTNLAALTPASDYLISDYGSQWDLPSGTWTAPDDGIYTVDVGDVYSAWVNGTDTGLGVQRNSPNAPFSGTYQYVRYTEYQSSGGGSCALSASAFFQAGDTMRCIAVQRTGAPQSILITGHRSTIRVSRAF